MKSPLCVCLLYFFSTVYVCLFLRNSLFVVLKEQDRTGLWLQLQKIKSCFLLYLRVQKFRVSSHTPVGLLDTSLDTGILCWWFNLTWNQNRTQLQAHFRENGCINCFMTSVGMGFLLKFEDLHQLLRFTCCSTDV